MVHSRAAPSSSPARRAASAGHRACCRSRGRRCRAHVSGERRRRARGRARDPSLGRRAAVLQLDVADDASLGALGPAARDALGRLDVWVNNAGADILTGAGASLLSIEKLDLLLAVDLRGTMLASWQAAEMLGAQEDGGVIINMSWDHVLTGMAGTQPADVRRGEGRRARVQQIAGAVASRRACASTSSRPAGSRRRSARGSTRRRRRDDRRVDAAQAVGHARGRRRRRRLSRVAGRGVPDRADDPGRRRRGDVRAKAISMEGETNDRRRSTWPRRNRRTTKRRSPSAAELPGWYLRGRLDPPRLQDRRLADDADARQRDRLLCRGGVSPSRSRR